MSLNIRADLQRFIEEQVKAGRFATETEAVNVALELLREQQAADLGDWPIDELRREVAKGIEQADRGEFSDFSAEQVIADGRKRLARKKAVK